MKIPKLQKRLEVRDARLKTDVRYRMVKSFKQVKHVKLLRVQKLLQWRRQNKHYEKHKMPKKGAIQLPINLFVMQLKLHDKPGARD